MKHILKFTFSIAFLMLSFLSVAQETTSKKSDSIASKKERFGLRLGVDLYKIARSSFDSDYTGIEFVGDYRITRKHYLAAEIGNENKTIEEDYLNFTTKGSYFKVGFDYNTYENWLNMNNMIYIGLRYGISSFDQTLNNYEIYSTNRYFNETVLIESGEKFDHLSAHWVEAVVGVKAEILKNLYAGFSFRLNRLITQNSPKNFENLYIPGFNKTYGGNFGIGFNYTLSYFIPLYKSTVNPKMDKK